MPNISPNSNDGQCSVLSTTSWVDAKDTTSQLYNSTNRFLFNAVGATKQSGRGGSIFYGIARSFFYFDTSGISVAPSAANFNWKGYHANFVNANFFIIKSTHGTTLSAGDFDSFPLSSSPGSNDGSGGGDMESLVTKYSGEVTTFNAGSFNLIELNATARADMASLDTFKVCLMEYDHDYLDVEEAVIRAVGFFWADYTSTSRDPYIDYTAAVAATDNSIFFGTNF